MIKALDEQFGKVLSPEEAAALGSKKEQYRLAKALGGVDVKEGTQNLNALRRAVDKANKKGTVMSKAVELLQAADIGIPKISGNDLASTPGMAAIGSLAVNPMILVKALVGAAGSKVLLNTGGPQYLAKSPPAKTATSRALRGALQTDLSDED